MAKEVALQEARSAAARTFEALERVKERALPVRRNPSPAATVSLAESEYPHTLSCDVVM